MKQKICLAGVWFSLVVWRARCDVECQCRRCMLKSHKSVANDSVFEKNENEENRKLLKSASAPNQKFRRAYVWVCRIVYMSVCV